MKTDSSRADSPQIKHLLLQNPLTQTMLFPKQKLLSFVLLVYFHQTHLLQSGNVSTETVLKGLPSIPTKSAPQNPGMILARCEIGNSNI